MSDKQTVVVYFEYDNGTAAVATGEHAKEVMAFLNGAQAMACVHGAEYRGRTMREVPSVGLAIALEESATAAEPAKEVL